MIDMSLEPLANVEWRAATSLNANDYNPNVVHTPELALLERSLLLTRWVQPVLIRKAEPDIIDGFHRTQLSMISGALQARYAGLVPCAVLDVSRSQAMIITIRMNRAKGTHVALRMSKIVHELLEVHQFDRQEIAVEIGGTLDEVDLLAQDGVFKAKGIPDHKYSSAWYPEEKPREV